MGFMSEDDINHLLKTETTIEIANKLFKMQIKRENLKRIILKNKFKKTRFGIRKNGYL